MDYEKYLTKEMSAWLSSLGNSVCDITLISGRNLFASLNGEIIESNVFITKETLTSIVERMCRGSIYANQSTLKHGYVTLEGGDRVGVAGSIVQGEDGKAAYMRDITALNIRISREIKGAADLIMPYIMENKKVRNTLIISPPSRGKTTLLRDAARQCGNMIKCGIVDERREIAGFGNKVHDLGKYTVVLDSCPKGEGIMMMLRSMAPQAIFTDEIGSEEDEEAILKMLNAGVKIVCTAHGYDEHDVMRRKGLRQLVENNVFEKIIILSQDGKLGSLKKVIA